MRTITLVLLLLTPAIASADGLSANDVTELLRAGLSEPTITAQLDAMGTRGLVLTDAQRDALVRAGASPALLRRLTETPRVQVAARLADRPYRAARALGTRYGRLYVGYGHYAGPYGPYGYSRPLTADPERPVQFYTDPFGLTYRDATRLGLGYTRGLTPYWWD